MWWVRENSDHSRGGFQNRDVGRTVFDNEFGPDHGVDYARFADTPDFARDLKMKNDIRESLARDFEGILPELEIVVRNGFVILKGDVPDVTTRKLLEENVAELVGVRAVINQLHC